MAFYFCGQYINIDTNGKEVEWGIFTDVPHFLNSNDRYGYEWEKSA